MKPFRSILHFSVLIIGFSLQALAADVSPVKKRAPIREAKRLPVQPGFVQSADLSAQVVYPVLLAEVALQRGDIEVASKAYADLALRTRDPKVLERTIEVAEYAHRFDLALEFAHLWLDVEPTSQRARQVMIRVMILSDQLDGIEPHLIFMLETDKSLLGENLIGINRMFTRISDRQAVFRLIDKVCRSFFGVAEAHYAVAIAANSAGAYERALVEIRRALQLRPDWEMAAIVEAQILSRESHAEAINFLQGFIEHNPKARDVQLNLARVLITEKRYGEAKRHFEQLLVDSPDNPEIVYPVAILALQQNDRGLAEAQLKHFLTLNVPDKSAAYYHLGQIAEEDKRAEEAVAYYAQVGIGEQYLSAQLRRAHILADQGKLELARKQLSEATVRTPVERLQLLMIEARLLSEANQIQAAFDLLEKGLIDQPEQPDLLYETALLAEKTGRLDILEKRLRKLIELRPESAQAYNALGYSYAERNLRLPEARALIEKALKLAPEDAAILDSMGWVLYRQGEVAAASAYLERALAKRHDPEIAAHLGEVLWVLGRKEDARRVANDALQKFPTNEALVNAIKKFAP